MLRLTRRSHLALGTSALAILTAVGLSSPAYAVEQTARLQGHVANASADTTVLAVDKNTGQRIQVKVRSDGSYILIGLRPGSYEITAGSDKEHITLIVGVTASLDLDATAAAAESVTVTGVRERLQTHEVHTSEVATSVSQVQIDKLPQLDRNFLSFATLAPGVTTGSDPENKTFQSGASTANNVNVYIDGQSQKQQVLLGGVAGQNTSRGNPFPMLAVDEFKVSTQNFKAEYEQAGAAIITAITKTGGNEFHGDAFEEFESKDMTGQPYYDRHNPKPNYSRHQYGGDLSGPIIQDKLHFYLAYEAVDELRAGDPYIFGPFAPASLQSLNGTSTPKTFHEQLGFGKLTWDPDDNNTVDWSFSYRNESELKNIGGISTFAAGTNQNQFVQGSVLTWTHRMGDAVNELSLQFQTAHWRQTDVESTPNVTLVYQPGEVYPGGSNQTVAQLGGAPSNQVKSQSDITFKDTVTLTGFEWNGQHVFKFGIKVARYEFDAVESLYQYFYDTATYDPSSSANVPYKALANIGNPDVRSHDVELGVFAQDDWTIDDHWTVNAGIRWDYESNMLNSNYVTPPLIAAAIRSDTNFINAGYNPEDFISTGSNRSAFLGMFQPRVGVSYDLYGDGQTVFFGGGGRYYDRDIYDWEQLETRRAYSPRIQINFGSGAGQVPWNTGYLDRTALKALAVTAGGQEIFALNNHTKVPFNDQFDLGVRQKFGDYSLSLTLSQIEGHHLFTWMLGNRNPDGSWCSFGPQYSCQPWGFPLPGFGNFIISHDNGKSHYQGILLGVEKPYTKDDGWGFTTSLTLNNARALGPDQEFGFDYATPPDSGWHAAPGVDRVRFVGSGIIDGPWGTSLSTLVTLGSGPSFDSIDNSGPALRIITNKLYPKGILNYKQIDLRIAKDFEIFDGQMVTIDGQVYNVFDWVNKTWSGWNGGFNGGSGPSRMPDNATTGPARTFQVGLKYRF